MKPECDTHHNSLRDCKIRKKPHLSVYPSRKTHYMHVLKISITSSEESGPDSTFCLTDSS